MLLLAWTFCIAVECLPFLSGLFMTGGKHHRVCCRGVICQTSARCTLQPIVLLSLVVLACFYTALNMLPGHRASATHLRLATAVARCFALQRLDSFWGIQGFIQHLTLFKWHRCFNLENLNLVCYLLSFDLVRSSGKMWPAYTGFIWTCMYHGSPHLNFIPQRDAGYLPKNLKACFLNGVDLLTEATQDYHSDMEKLEICMTWKGLTFHGQ